MSEADPLAASAKILESVLEYEQFLLKVLACVMTDGLRECRLVCRQWRDVCGKLPVRLTTRLGFELFNVKNSDGVISKRYVTVCRRLLGVFRKNGDRCRSNPSPVETRETAHSADITQWKAKGHKGTASSSFITQPPSVCFVPCRRQKHSYHLPWTF